ncbi:hypothetical protein [Noviherbaspirillum aridicola]|uniref:Lipoprotein n=1 Tax=Noviherbaspirillum aridicola TaxID=2849687 RepID=A0ABQ4Q4D7_9BURK|nr:hypothetical protein [Noviherbaspirillum aridicola]GIZ52053.1 hypothetical protein NCCP691_20670 [Noviherbaspirillum aridicola]
MGHRTILCAGLALALLAACQRTPEPKTGAGDVTPGSSPSVSSAPAGGSVADPSATGAAPGTTEKPADTTANSGDANTPTQANPAPLAKQQEQAGMPHSGQVNNHSVPETTGTTKQ